ncbi:MAG: hypothetical protein KME57_01045 [Scytonema hyalinum WJT4-NPBG1]|jgi:hypothetical protein|nr:hypothetical protein [Scytonema hyalinum WJT4-NPBG1]
MFLTQPVSQITVLIPLAAVDCKSVYLALSPSGMPPARQAERSRLGRETLLERCLTASGV